MNHFKVSLFISGIFKVEASPRLFLVHTCHLFAFNFTCTYPSLIPDILFGKCPKFSIFPEVVLSLAPSDNFNFLCWFQHSIHSTGVWLHFVTAMCMSRPSNSPPYFLNLAWLGMHQGLTPMEANVALLVLLYQAVCSPLNSSAFLSSGIPCVNHLITFNSARLGIKKIIKDESSTVGNLLIIFWSNTLEQYNTQ